MVSNNVQIDRVPGIYILIAVLNPGREIRIGALGTFDFPEGLYAYIGSARGPGGLHARLKRHLRPPARKKLHWHIDYLLQHAAVQHICWSSETVFSECEWAEKTASLGIRLPPRFGASDCGCEGHLVRLNISHVNELHQLLSDGTWTMDCAAVDEVFMERS